VPKVSTKSRKTRKLCLAINLKVALFVPLGTHGIKKFKKYVSLVKGEIKET